MTILSKHAEEAVENRNLRFDWIERLLTEPDFVRPDPDPTLTRSFKAIVQARGKRRQG